MAATRKIIAIIGATGNQGSSVANTFLTLHGWIVRAITRDVNSQKAKALRLAGAEVVQADLGNVASLEAAFAGASVIYVNTDFWAIYHTIASSTSASKLEARQTALATEIQHAKNAAAAASSPCVLSTLDRYIYSALGPMSRASGGKYTESYHWEGKASAVDHIATIPELAAKTSFIYIGAYASNAFLIPKLNAETGDHELLVPCKAETKFPILDVPESTGPFVRALLDEPAGTKVLAYDSYLTFTEIVEAWEDAVGKKAKFLGLSMEEMRKRTGVTDEVLQGAAFIGEYSYMGGVDNWIAPEQMKNPPQTRSYDEYLQRQTKDYLLGGEFEKV